MGDGEVMRERTATRPWEPSIAELQCQSAADVCVPKMEKWEIRLGMGGEGLEHGMLGIDCGSVVWTYGY